MDERLRIVDFVDDESWLRDQEFEDVTLVGPGVLVITHDVTLTNVQIGAPLGVADFVDAVLWEIPEGAFKVGVIGVCNVAFENVAFENVAFAGTPEVIADLKRDLFGAGPGPS